jgi:hypothetical protein
MNTALLLFIILWLPLSAALAPVVGKFIKYRVRNDDLV